MNVRCLLKLIQEYSISSSWGWKQYLELIPNNQDDEGKPVEFMIEFTEAGYRIRYELIIYVGAFMETEAKRRVLKETLMVNGEMVFERNPR